MHYKNKILNKAKKNLAKISKTKHPTKNRLYDFVYMCTKCSYHCDVNNTPISKKCNKCKNKYTYYYNYQGSMDAMFADYRVQKAEPFQSVSTLFKQFHDSDLQDEINRDLKMKYSEPLHVVPDPDPEPEREPEPLKVVPEPGREPKREPLNVQHSDNQDEDLEKRLYEQYKKLKLEKKSMDEERKKKLLETRNQLLLETKDNNNNNNNNNK